MIMFKNSKEVLCNI